MVLRTDAPVDFDRSSIDWGVVDVKEVQRLFELLEFNSLYERLSEILEGALPSLDSGTAVLDAELVYATSAEECITALIPMQEQTQPLSLGWVADEDGSLIALAVLQNGETAEVLVIEHELLRDPDLLAALSSFTAQGGIGFDAHNAKEITRGFRQLGTSTIRNGQWQASLRPRSTMY